MLVEVLLVLLVPATESLSIKPPFWLSTTSAHDRNTAREGGEEGRGIETKKERKGGGNDGGKGERRGRRDSAIWMQIYVQVLQ